MWDGAWGALRHTRLGTRPARRHKAAQQHTAEAPQVRQQATGNTQQWGTRGRITHSPCQRGGSASWAPLQWKRGGCRVAVVASAAAKRSAASARALECLNHVLFSSMRRSLVRCALHDSAGRELRRAVRVLVFIRKVQQLNFLVFFRSLQSPSLVECEWRNVLAGAEYLCRLDGWMWPHCSAAGPMYTTGNWAANATDHYQSGVTRRQTER